MRQKRIVDHIRILLVMPAVYLTYQLLANSHVALLPLIKGNLPKGLFHVWLRYLSELLICFGCMASAFFISPRTIRYISLIVVLIFYAVNVLSMYLIPFDLDDSGRFMATISIIYYGSAALAYAVMAAVYEKRRVVQ